MFQIHSSIVLDDLILPLSWGRLVAGAAPQARTLRPLDCFPSAGRREMAWFTARRLKLKGSKKL